MDESRNPKSDEKFSTARSLAITRDFAGDHQAMSALFNKLHFVGALIAVWQGHSVRVPLDAAVSTWRTKASHTKASPLKDHQRPIWIIVFAILMASIAIRVKASEFVDHAAHDTRELDCHAEHDLRALDRSTTWGKMIDQIANDQHPNMHD